jgi:hypothetical protein
MYLNCRSSSSVLNLLGCLKQKKMMVFKNENEAKQSLDMNIFKAI